MSFYLIRALLEMMGLLIYKPIFDYFFFSDLAFSNAEFGFIHLFNSRLVSATFIWRCSCAV
jgi:hypothetical protein